MITIQEVGGSDNIAPSRLTINSNFLLIENEVNDLENTFNINVVTGSLDVSQATSGQIKAKSLYADQLVLPSAGSPNINLYGTGANAGNGAFTGTLSANNINIGGTGTYNNLTATGNVAFSGGVINNGSITYNNSLISGSNGNYIEKNTIAIDGLNNQFAQPGSGGGGVIGTYSNPYALSFTESVIYADCGYVSSAVGDIGNTKGFFISIGSVSGSTLTTTIPQGFKLTIINTNSSDGLIATGLQSNYYTGFSTNSIYNTTGIGINASYAYKASVTLMFENRIGKNNGGAQKGSWVVLSDTTGIELLGPQ